MPYTGSLAFHDYLLSPAVLDRTYPAYVQWAHLWKHLLTPDHIHTRWIISSSGGLEQRRCLHIAFFFLTSEHCGKLQYAMDTVNLCLCVCKEQIFFSKAARKAGHWATCKLGVVAQQALLCLWFCYCCVVPCVSCHQWKVPSLNANAYWYVDMGFYMHNNFSACCALVVKTGMGESAQVLIQRNWKSPFTLSQLGVKPLNH